MTLALSQRDFSRALFDPAVSASAGLRVASGVDPQRRFAVHRNNAVVALVDALAAAFPITQALVGEDFFRAMARERVRIDPPRSPILAKYGDGFAGFIAGFAPAVGVPYLADIARLERFRMQAYHAADAEPVALDAYRMLVTEPARLADTRLSLHPACRWLRSRYAVRSIWQAHQQLDDLQHAELAHIDIDAPEQMLITRAQWDVDVSPLPAGAAACLDALRAGATLGDAAMGFAAADGAGRHAAQFETLFALIVQHGLAVALHSPTEP